jgi:glutathione S-transferase
MAKLDFQDSTLFISARSPFARRVRLAFREAGIRHSERVVDVLKPTAELLERNPLARIPVVELRNGRVLIESQLILNLMYEAQPSPLLPEGEARIDVLQWGALAAGVAEKTVEYFFEILRPEAHRDPELIREIEGIINRVLGRLEAAIGSRPWIVGPEITQADLDLGTMLRYLCLRHSSAWRKTHPNCSRYLESLESRPSFRETHPPDA